jgi:hypothetical protein
MSAARRTGRWARPLACKFRAPEPCRCATDCLRLGPGRPGLDEGMAVRGRCYTGGRAANPRSSRRATANARRAQAFQSSAPASVGGQFTRTVRTTERTSRRSPSRTIGAPAAPPAPHVRRGTPGHVRGLGGVWLSAHARPTALRATTPGRAERLRRHTFAPTASPRPCHASRSWQGLILI